MKGLCASNVCVCSPREEFRILLNGTQGNKTKKTNKKIVHSHTNTHIQNKAGRETKCPRACPNDCGWAVPAPSVKSTAALSRFALWKNIWHPENTTATTTQAVWGEGRERQVAEAGGMLLVGPPSLPKRLLRLCLFSCRAGAGVPKGVRPGDSRLDSIVAGRAPSRPALLASALRRAACGDGWRAEMIVASWRHWGCYDLTPDSCPQGTNSQQRGRAGGGLLGHGGILGEVSSLPLSLARSPCAVLEESEEGSGMWSTALELSSGKSREGALARNAGDAFGGPGDEARSSGFGSLVAQVRDSSTRPPKAGSGSRCLSAATSVPVRAPRSDGFIEASGV